MHSAHEFSTKSTHWWQRLGLWWTPVVAASHKLQCCLLLTIQMGTFSSNKRQTVTDRPETKMQLFLFASVVFSNNALPEFRWHYSMPSVSPFGIYVVEDTIQYGKQLSFCDKLLSMFGIRWNTYLPLGSE